MLEDLLAEELVGVVGDAEALAELEIVQAGLFLDLAQGAGLDRVAGLLLAFGQVPDVVPVPTSDALTPTPDDVSPDANDADVEKSDGAAAEKPAKKATRRTATRKRSAAAVQQPPKFVPSPAPDSVVNLLDDELMRLRKMAPRTVKKLQNTIMTQFKSVNAEAAVTSLVTRGIITIDGTHINWLQPDGAVKMETAGPAAEDEKAGKPKSEKGSKGDE